MVSVLLVLLGFQLQMIELCLSRDICGKVIEVAYLNGTGCALN